MVKTSNPLKGKSLVTKPAVDKEEKTNKIDKVKTSSESNNVIKKYL